MPHLCARIYSVVFTRWNKQKNDFECSVWRSWLWSISFTRDSQAWSVLTQSATDTFDLSWRITRLSPVTPRAFRFQSRRLKIPFTEESMGDDPFFWLLALMHKFHPKIGDILAGRSVLMMSPNGNSRVGTNYTRAWSADPGQMKKKCSRNCSK